MNSRSARFRLIALTAFAAVVLTGCFRVHVDVEVREDGSGRVSVLSAIDRTAMGNFGSFEDGGALGDPCEEMLADARSSATSDGVTVEPYEDGDFCGAEITVEFEAGDDVSRSIAEAMAGVNDDDLGVGSGDMTIRRDGDGWLFESLNMDNAGGSEMGGEDMSAFADQLLEGAEMSMRIKLPGRQIEHNADRIESDGTMVWELDLAGEKRDRFFLRTEPGETITGSSDGGGGKTLLIVAAVVVLAGLIGFFVWRQTRRPSGGTPEATGFATPPEAMVPAGPPAAAEPQWDAALGAYVMNDPIRGRLAHDPDSGEWRQVPSPE